MRETVARWVGAAKMVPTQRVRPPMRRRGRDERNGIAKETSFYRGCIGRREIGFSDQKRLLTSFFLD
jgi:hypothetical protein